MKASFLNYSFLISFLFSFSLHSAVAQGASGFDYDKEWKAVHELQKKQKPRSALEIVERIYAEAKKDKNQPQMLKALEFSIRISMSYEEDFFQKGLARIDEEMPSFSAPATQVLHSLKADLYLGYYSRNRYMILDRTTLAEDISADIATWDQQRFADKIFTEFRLSLENPELLQKTPAEEYSSILKKQDSPSIFRPSLFDILAHHALGFYMNDEFMVSQPVLRFEINDARMLDLAESFVKLELQEIEKYSMPFHALKLYQELIAFHLHDEDPAALVDVDLMRLQYVHSNAVFPDRDKILLHTLEQMESLYMGKEAVTEIYYHIARLYQGSANQFDPLVSDEHKRDLLVAEQYCENAQEEFPRSYGAALCKNLLTEIRRKALDCSTDYAGIPARPILSSISYKNISTLYLRVVPLDPEDQKKRSFYHSENILENYRKLRPVKQWSVELPGEIDHNSHTSELAIPPLPEGFYGLMISDDPAFNLKKGVTSICNFWISNLSYISREQENGDLQFYVLDRASGKQLAGVQVKVYREQYDNRQREYILADAGSYTSDDEGRFSIPAVKGQSKQLLIDLQKDGDRFFSPSFFYSSARVEQPEKSVPVTHFFTDRSIYRPGQTIYFKGILMERTGENYTILKNKSTTVQLYDANYQMVSELSLSSNEYGSVQGSFTAPQGGLTGYMRIKNESGQLQFSVEEYKRPRFEVAFDPVKGSYKLNEELNISGKAMAYSGNALDQAKVKYRVVRNTYFPWRYYWGGYFPEENTTEILSGETQTDENGAFSIEFTAIPDRGQHRHYDPVFLYTVYADVTDLNGETHSGQKSVSVGEKSLLIELDLPELLNADEKENFELKTTNLNGEDEPAEVSVQIMQLKTPGRIIREREWDRPDVYLLAEEEFRQFFPDREYKDENDKNNWETIDTKIDQKIDTREERQVMLKGLRTWEPGEYKIEMKARDVFGEEIKQIQYFSLYSPSSDKLPMAVANWFVPLKTTAEPGEKASFLIGTSYDHVSVLYEVSGKNGLLKQEWISLSDEQKLIEIPVNEEDRGGLEASLIFVHENKSYSNTLDVSVPYSNKELDISFASFRDKLLPGQEEEWQIRIRSHTGDKVAAEMLATLYDASLDAISPHYWYLDLYQEGFYRNDWNTYGAFNLGHSRMFSEQEAYDPIPARLYDMLDWEGIYRYGYYAYDQMDIMPGRVAQSRAADIGGVLLADKSAEYTLEEDESENISRKENPPANGSPEENATTGEIPVRRNLQETAFFFPNLKTNEDGDVILSFTMPESLTRWKMMGLAHTTDLKIGHITKELVTQKDLMVVPNLPRFFREGDAIYLSARVVNMSEKELRGNASLQLLDAAGMKVVNEDFGLSEAEADFSASEGQSALLSWKLIVPENVGPVFVRITASAGNFSDGEEMMLPVLKNRMLVTESMPLHINGKESREFVFEKMATAEQGGSMKNYSYTLEFTSNPAWYAVQALPYLMEFPHECSEQLFNRIYANSFATHIVEKQPKIKNIFESWKVDSPDALLSKLEKNQDLKNALLEETPWVMQAKDESERKQRIALLFDLNKMSNEMSNAIGKLKQQQLGSGGWPWFAGGRENRYITQYILGGFGKLQHLGVITKDDSRVNSMVKNAIRYMDERMFEDFQRIKEKHKDYRTENHLSRTNIQYLYARSYFSDEYFLLAKHKEAYLYFKEQAKKYWTEEDKYLQGMIALALHRMGDEPIPRLIMTSIKEHALYDDEMGMYWRQDAGYYWYEAPIETQALLIEAFDEILQDAASVEQMKTWLLKQKQTQDWETTRATADACYALLLRGADLLAEEGDVSISVGGQLIDPDQLDGVEKEAGTGYFSHRWNGSDISPEMAEIEISKSNEGVAWGAVYWQYFEDLDKITPHASPLSIVKKLFVERNTAEGPVLEAVKDGDVLETGDKLVSRIEIRVDRDMEFVHMKDMRAAALEPRNALSGYRWQGGLGYYESIRDASVNFFFSSLHKGTWVFEYPLNVTQRGSFSNGITSIQCMYAPEFAAHSEGVRIVVE